MLVVYSATAANVSSRGGQRATQAAARTNIQKATATQKTAEKATATKTVAKTKIENMQLSDLQNIPLPPLCYIVRIDGTNIKLQLIYTELLISNRYMVTIKNIPLNKYVLEQFKYMAPNIVELKEPKISLRLNPGITKDDIKEAKEMALKLKRNHY